MHMVSGKRAISQYVERLLPVLLTLAGSVVFPNELAGQSDVDGNRTGEHALLFEARAGVVAYGTGNEQFCNPGRAGSVGAEARIRGPWLLSASADLHLQWGLLCRDVLRATEYEKELVGVWGDTELVFDPRFAIHGGYEFIIPIFGGLHLAPTVGAGVQFTQMRFGETAGGDSDDWRPWYGGTLSVRPSNFFGLGFQIERGRHQLLRRYCPLVPGDCLLNGGIIREFTIWREFTRIGITYTIS